MTQKEVATRFDWNSAKVIRIEAGRVGVSTTDLRALLDLYGIQDPAQVDTLMGMARQSRKQAWAAYRDALNPDFLVYLGCEGSAAVLRQVESQFLPGLLQIAEYASTVIESLRGSGTSESVMQQQLEVRLRRQQLLDRPHPPKMYFLLDEVVIRRVIGGPKVMRRQLAHLNALGERPDLHLRVVPFARGAHMGLKGSFVILEFPEPEDDDLLFIESGYQSVASRDDASEVSYYRKAYFDLESSALSEAETLQLIDQARRGM